MNGNAPWIASLLLATAGLGLFGFSFFSGSTSDLNSAISSASSVKAPNNATITEAANLRKASDAELEAMRASLRSGADKSVIAKKFELNSQRFHSQQWPTAKDVINGEIRGINLINPPLIANGATLNAFESFERWKARTGGTTMDAYKAYIVDTWGVDPLISLDEIIKDGKVAPIMADDEFLGRVALTCVDEVVNALKGMSSDIAAPGMRFQLRNFDFSTFATTTTRSLSSNEDDAFSYHRYDIEMMVSPQLLPKVIQKLRAMTLDGVGPKQYIWMESEYESITPVGIDSPVADSVFEELGTKVPDETVEYEKWRTNELTEAAVKAMGMLSLREQLPMRVKVRMNVVVPRLNHKLIAKPVVDAQN